MERISKENYYLNIAQTVLERATCLRRVFGAIIVKNDEIISTGYNGAPRGRRNCVDMGLCTREAMPGTAVRAVPQRPRRGQRHHLRRPAGHGGRHAVSGGPQCPDRRAASRCHLLRHVPPTRHQCGTFQGGHPQYGDGVLHRGRAGLGGSGGRRAGSAVKES